MSKQPKYKTGTVGNLMENLKKLQEWHLTASAHPTLPKDQQQAHKHAAKTLGDTAKVFLSLKNSGL